MRARIPFLETEDPGPFYEFSKGKAKGKTETGHGSFIGIIGKVTKVFSGIIYIFKFHVISIILKANH